MTTPTMTEAQATVASVRVPSHLLFNALNNVKGATAKASDVKGTGTEHLSGVHVQVRPGGMQAYATNRYVAAIQEITYSELGYGDKDLLFTLSPAGLKVALETLKAHNTEKKSVPAWFYADGDGNIRIAVGSGEYNMASNAVETMHGDYPDVPFMYRQFAPAENAEPASVTHYNTWTIKLLGSLTLIDRIHNRQPIAVSVRTNPNPARATSFNAEGEGWSIRGLIMPVRKP